MASPAISQCTYRLSEVPSDVSIDEIKLLFPPEDRALIQFTSKASSLYSTSYVVTITFSRQPSSIRSINAQSRSLSLRDLLVDLDPRFIDTVVDSHFLGLTPLNDVADEEQAVDVVAVSGLAGRPFGSWQADDGSMWLRNHLVLDIPNIRVLLFGYSSKVVKSDSSATLKDFTEDLLRALESSRPFDSIQRRRPLVLIGHSLGGIIIKDAWVRCSETDSSFRRDLRRALFGIVFFGTPHEGMEVSNLIAAAEGNPAEILTRDLAPGSSTTRLLKERFAKSIRELKVLSCYELRSTPTLIKLPDGTYDRTGEKKLMVPEHSACLFWPDDVETRIPIDENHSMIGKLSARVESKYHIIKTEITSMVHDARKQVANRFLREDVLVALRGIYEAMTFVYSKAQSTADIKPYSEDIQRNIIDIDALRNMLFEEQIGSVFLGPHASLSFTSRIGDMIQDFRGSLLEYENLASKTSPGRQVRYLSTPPSTSTNLNSKSFSGRHARLFQPSSIQKIVETCRNLTQALKQTFSLSMLTESKEVDWEAFEQRPVSRQLGLGQVARQQAIMRSKIIEPSQALPGTIHIDNTKASSSSLTIGQYQSSDSTAAHSVIVEYKQYTRRVGRVANDGQEVFATKELARKLATAIGQAAFAATSNETGFGPMAGPFQWFGYVDEVASGRLAFLYEIPHGYLQDDGTLSPGVRTLRDYIKKDIAKIPLEQRFSLASSISMAILNLHILGWVHKSIRSENVVLFPRSSGARDVSAASLGGIQHSYDVYIKGFEYSREALARSDALDASDKSNLYRHPDRQGLPMHFTKEYDLYAVGLVLLELGTGSTLDVWADGLRKKLRSSHEELEAETYRGGFLRIAKTTLPRSMGSSYAKAVVRCIEGDFDVHQDDKEQTQLGLSFQQLIVDEVSRGLKL